MSERRETTESGFWAETDRDGALRRFRTLVNTIDDGIYQLDPSGRFVAVNDVIVEATGYARAELLGEHVSLVLCEDDISRIEAAIRRALETDVDPPTLELEIETAAGNALPCELRCNCLVEDGEFRGTVGVVRDVSTVAARVERARKLSQYERIVETVEDGIYVLDEEYRFAVVNEAYVEMTGYPRETLLGSHCSLVVGDEVSAEAAERSLETVDGQEAATIEAEILRGNGDRLPAESRFTALTSDAGEYEGTIGVVRDVTDRKARERALRESNERLEQFAYAASHDLQEPLRMVSSYLQLLERRYGDELGADGREFVEFAVDGAERMSDMIEGLLQYARVETQGDSFESVELDALFDDVLDDLAIQIDERGAEITVSSLPRVDGDADQLRQVFQNLLCNAITYGGERPRVAITAEADGPKRVIAVRDDGIGIDPAHHDRIFEVFRRLHGPDEYDGTGIGLALCQRVVDRHGGEIWVDSAPDEGSTFFVALPATRA
ncbi:sensor histidine kinase [Natronorubrum texcoconense]|uniref:histidine kinase n=1 Tax=Natronorubrum texcoconense TaxID=1095776 RepID=A0A1G8TBE0_9EURY|nr:PAS domain S-box protein [Natronorubrum texcoconense]SDJ38902.1 PAS domain S-box-containing protein [Natronorubrum texcoconense]